jgi:hypothetical protein
MAETRKVTGLIDAGDLLARDGQLHLYRRALYEARRNDLDLNSSEAALLALLRRESAIAQVEHFLIEHHEDFREFWDRDDAFVHEEKALRSAGLIQPYAKHGPHDVRNGVLLRADLHRLFDQGHVTITPEYRLEVSPRLKEDYRNGRSYYPLHGSSVSIPTAAADAPSVDFLRWHNERVYRAT